MHLFMNLFSCYRKAISRTGLQHLAPAHPLGLPVANGPAKEPRATLDWSVGVYCFLFGFSPQANFYLRAVSFLPRPQDSVSQNTPTESLQWSS